MQLGPYELTTAIGAGGMGEVWRARDERLGRDVAVKILPASFANDAERVKRFEQEARAAGSLNHPNLVTIFDAGTDNGIAYIAMELLEGETIREKLQNGRIPLRKAADYAIQAATGLAAAHEKGIIHRDLKPENLFVCRDGRVKILDFGLAKLTSNSTNPDAPTERLATTPGVVMGTVAYMSPEQVRAQKADHRSDIFSFGAVLFEMVTGKRAFGGDTAADLMSAILHSDPPELTTISGDAPPALASIVRHCLEKSPDERFQSVRDLAFHLQSISGSSATARTTALPAKSRSRIPLIVAAPVIAAILLTIGLLYRSGFRVRKPQMMVTDAAQLTYQPGEDAYPSIAPDGKTFVYVSGPFGSGDIYLQRIDGRNAINLTKESKSDNWEPAFSPDGSQIVFRSQRSGGGLFIMGATGEAVRRISDFGYNPSWSPDGSHIVCATETTEFNPRGRSTNSELWIIDVKSGEKRLLTRENRPTQPSWSPHGNRIAYWIADSKTSQRDIYTIDPDTANAKPVALTRDAALDWNPIWAPDGRTIYFASDRGGTMGLWRIGIDEKSGTPRGEPQPINLPARYAAHFTIDRSGRQLLFASHERYDGIRRARRDGSELSTIVGGSMPIFLYDLSPDGQSIAYSTFDRDEQLFVVKTDGTDSRQITDSPERKRGVSWTPDGKIVYYSNRSGTQQIWQINPDGTGLLRITDTPQGLWYPVVSPDRKTLLTNNETKSFLLSLASLPATKPVEFPPAPIAGFHFVGTSWSPDSRYILGNFERTADEFFEPKVIQYDTLTHQYQEILNFGSTADWTPDGKGLIVNDKNRIKLVGLDTKSVTELPVQVDSADPSRVKMSADGQWIYWSERHFEGDIWRVTLDER